MWDLSSPTRDRTRVPCIGRWILDHWTTREVPGWVTLQLQFTVLKDDMTFGFCVLGEPWADQMRTQPEDEMPGKTDLQVEAAP